MSKRKQLKKDLNLPMSSKEYLEKEGLECPVCNGKHLAIQETNTKRKYIIQAISCRHCKALWCETYVLIKYDSLKRYDPDKDNP